MSSRQDALRSGLLRRLAASLQEPVPPSYLRDHLIGVVVVFLLLLEGLTGAMLSFYYQPSVEVANESLRYIVRDVDAGWLLRGVHHWGSQALLAAVTAWMAAVLIRGGYRAPHHSRWRLGLVFLLLVFLLAWTGSILPWDQAAHGAAVLALNWLEGIPLAGGAVARVLRGGDTFGPATLAHFYAVHILILPGLLILVVALFAWLGRGPGDREGGS